MLRPVEYLGLLRSDLILPSDRGEEVFDLIVRVRKPKTRRYCHRQHARVTDQMVIALCSAAFAHLPLDGPLTAYTASTFRSALAKLLAYLGIPFGRKFGGPTLASLRGTGATELYLMTEDIAKIAWRGRWRSMTSLERYLQDSAGALLLQQLTPESRALIRVFAEAAAGVLNAFVRDPCHWLRVARLG